MKIKLCRLFCFHRVSNSCQIYFRSRALQTSKNISAVFRRPKQSDRRELHKTRDYFSNVMEELPITVDENNFEAGTYEILKKIRPSWSRDSISFKLFTDGITNKLIGCFSGADEVLLVRIYGNNTDLLIDRNAEKVNIAFLHKHGLAPELYATFRNGLVYEFVPGCTLNINSVNERKIWNLVAINMARMHKLPLSAEESTKEPMLKTKTIKFLNLVPEKFSDPAKHARVAETLPSRAELLAEFHELYAALVATESPILFCHNDLLPGNVIYTEESNKVTFIDYEYAEVNFQAFDIGNHFAEFPGIDSNSGIDYSKYPSREYQLEWIRAYLEEFTGGHVTDDDVELLFKQTNKFALSSHFLWSVWSLIQAEHSTIDFDFVAFAAIRYNEYLAKKEAFLSL